VNCFPYLSYARSGQLDAESVTQIAPFSPLWKCRYFQLAFYYYLLFFFPPPGIVTFLLFHSRFTPNQEGQWQYTIYGSEFGSSAVPVTSSNSFSVSSSNAPGFVRISSRDSRYFVFENSQATYFPIGEDLAWADDTYDYDMYEKREAKREWRKELTSKCVPNIIVNRKGISRNWLPTTPLLSVFGPLLAALTLKVWRVVTG